MAHPYTLNPSQCGHTFCAICILKWFFSRLHIKCGAWHESVDCPICRSLLVITPDCIPRHDSTFPFVPNRTAAAVCESLIEKLRTTSSAAPVVKREEKDALWEGEMECSRKETDKKATEDADVAGWREGGIMRTEWLKKDRRVHLYSSVSFLFSIFLFIFLIHPSGAFADSQFFPHIREGRKEMSCIVKNWPTLTSHDFRIMKQKLGV